MTDCHTGNDITVEGAVAVLFGGCASDEKRSLDSQDPEYVRILMVPYFLIEKNAKYSRKASSKKDLADGKFSQKGNCLPKRRSHLEDPESVKILFVPHFLIEKNTKYLRNIGDN